LGDGQNSLSAVTGRIRKKLIQAQLEALPAPRSDAVLCPLCERPIPSSQQDAHHLVPKSHGGVQTAVLHRICHRQIHALFTETELARQYATVEALKQHEEMVHFIRWVQTKPDAFFEKSRKSQRLKYRH
jgi:gluconate kinase